MKKLFVIAAIAALSACSDNDAAAPDATTSEAPAPVATETASSWIGTYEYTLEGKPTNSTIAVDGTYQDMQDGKVIESGSWAEKDGKVCFDPEGDAPESCLTTTTPDAEGMFTATSEDGKTVTTLKKTS